jgi:hypothetical protein
VQLSFKNASPWQGRENRPTGAIEFLLQVGPLLGRCLDLNEPNDLVAGLRTNGDGVQMAALPRADTVGIVILGQQQAPRRSRIRSYSSI